MQLIVLGMHRSGTSAVTRLLNMAGAYFGPEGSATEANEENPKGFWERKDVRRVCDGLLKDAGFDWWRLGSFDADAIPAEVREQHLGAFREILLGLDAHRPWVIKEPRLCLLFPLLRPLLEIPVCIHVTREPLEVAGSVAKRNGFPLPVGIALWEHYTLRSLQASVGVPRYHVRYEDLDTDPVGTLDQLLAWLEAQDVQGLHRPSEREVTAFVDPALHRQQRDSVDRRGMLNGEQAELADATDAGQLLDPQWEQREPSESAWATLRDFEARVDELTRARDDAEIRRREARDAENDARAARDETNAARRHAARMERSVDDGLREAEKQLESIERSRAWHVAQRLMRLRQQVVPGARATSRDGSHASWRRWRRSDAPSSRRRRSRTAARARAGTASSNCPAEFPLRHSGPAPAPRSPDRAEGGGHRVGRRAQPARARVLPGRDPRPSVRRRDLGHPVRALRRADLGAAARSPRSPSTPSTAGRSRSTSSAMEAVAERIDADAIWISKPRFPSLGLGVLAKQFRDRPLVLDVDDHELSFFDVDDGLGPRRAAQAVGERPRAPVRTGVDPGVRAGDHELRAPDGVERRAASSATAA